MYSYLDIRYHSSAPHSAACPATTERRRKHSLATTHRGALSSCDCSQKLCRSSISSLALPLLYDRDRFLLRLTALPLLASASLSARASSELLHAQMRASSSDSPDPPTSITYRPPSTS
ncbi:hypothetical protein LMH87_007375 [Akanthomyces muscarius]|uniref:Uncharacterized protein n=1 Tax=Akanthomyces muscarius TaxID=2231603 RepID=A0A9W8QRH2_AKAMU|nr:hypothetical protein LMH87_007375 [Akanthomyces muscarius]KAJ4165755.1 hypothetical protein LMH87_007375 [Akanthomyces muscarius]